MNNITREVHTMNDAPEDRAKCGQCERDVGAIFCCPERLSGHCPFVEKWTQHVNAIPVMLFVFGVFPLAIVIFSGTSTWEGWAALACLVTALIFFAITQEKLLYNTQSHLRLQRTTFAGIQWSCRWSWDVGLPRVHFEPTPLLAYPLSISSLSDINADETQAMTIVRAALIELLAKQYIEAYLFRTYAVTRMRPRPTVVDNYVVVLAGWPTEGIENLGELEKRILLAVTHRSVQSVSKDPTEGLRLYEAVRAVYEDDQSNPSTWLAELVARNAVERGLGQIKAIWFTKTMEWNAAYLPRLREEEEISESLSEQLAKMYPEFSYVLNTQISRAIWSRSTESGRVE